MGAVENIITDNLPIWSSAIQSKSSAGRGASSKRRLYGVNKLRELILDLAVRGLLVPQDQSDRSATDALKIIKPRVLEIIKNEKFSNKTIEPNSYKTQFNIPENWAFCKLGELAAIARGGSPRPIKAY